MFFPDRTTHTTRRRRTHPGSSALVAAVALITGSLAGATGATAAPGTVPGPPARRPGRR
ncbi:hypothetical protein ACF081_18055 [Streptomyces longwoodensis]|uniref:hypothetical protein n=1 Tax=Streptomyces longwoodensis TaxID=68231 RepID=UPI0036FE5703